MSNTTTDPDSLFTPEDFLNLTIEHITEYSDEQIAELRRVLDKLPRFRREQQEWLRQDWQGYKMTTDQNTTTDDKHGSWQRGCVAWADKHATINRFGTKEYSPFVCHTMNLLDPRVRECDNECEWVAPFGWVPEAGCAIHD